jgi:hypothetical protein
MKKISLHNFPCEKINAFIFNDSSTKRIISDKD